MVKHCSYGKCNSDSRYPERLHGVRFISFPKPSTNRQQSLRWIRACGRPHHQLNIDTIKKDHYICSKVRSLDFASAHFSSFKPSSAL
jgi:hypothetical protein